MCAFSAGWTPRSRTATPSPCCPPWPAGSADRPTAPTGWTLTNALRLAARLAGPDPAGRAAAVVARPSGAAVGQARGPEPDRFGEGPGGVLHGGAGREG